MSGRRSYGAGSLSARVDGRWRETWYGRWHVNGQRVQRALGAKRASGSRAGLTKAQAEAELRRQIATARPTRAAGDRVTIAEASAQYIVAAERRGRKLSTRQNIESETRVHLAPFFGDRSIDSVSRADVLDLVTVLEGKRLAPKTIRNVVATLSALYRFALHPDRRWATSNPCAEIELPAVAERTEIRFLTVDQVGLLVANVPAGIFQELDRAIFLCTAMTGLRKGELVALRWRDVDWPAQRIRVRQNFTRGEFGTPKSRRSTRSVPMSDELAGELERLHQTSRWQGDAELVFAHPLTGGVQPKARISLRLHAALTAAGLPERRFHDLRHTFGTAMAAAGVPLRTLQEWLGHRDLATTQIYSDYSPSAGEAEMVARAFSSSRLSSHSESTDDDPR